MFDIVQVIGALLVLVRFLLAQLGRNAPAAYRYLVPNCAGPAVLTPPR